MQATQGVREEGRYKWRRGTRQIDGRPRHVWEKWFGDECRQAETEKRDNGEEDWNDEKKVTASTIYQTQRLANWLDLLCCPIHIFWTIFSVEYPIHLYYSLLIVILLFILFSYPAVMLGVC